MDMQITRHRGTRTSAFGTLSVGEFECVTLESRRDMLDPGRHHVSLGHGGVELGPHIVTDHAADGGVGGAVVLGLTGSRRGVGESSEAVDLLTGILKDLFKRGQSVELEVIDLIDYSAIDREILR